MNGPGIDPVLELERQRAENARLITLLESHGIEWRLPPEPVVAATEPEPESSKLSTDEKVALFRRLFRGRTDIYPVRWENSTTGISGYSPVCVNDRRHGICEKLIALSLQKAPRERGRSVFVDGDLRPFRDQWAFLATIQPMPAHDIEPTILRATGNSHPLDVNFIDEEDQKEPWKRPSPATKKLVGTMPKSLTVTVANLIYFEKAQLPQSLANRLIRLAAFQNPEFYKKQAMRFSVWKEPRVIGCAENYPNHIALPRGCLDAALDLLRENAIGVELVDERCSGEPIEVAFAGTLRLDQEAAVAAMLHHDAGVFCAPTAFDKTVTAAAMIARRGVNTLVLVHRTELLKQWQERLQSFLGIGKGVVGTIGGGKPKPTGKIDIAVMQSLSRLTERTEHLDAIQTVLDGKVTSLFVLHGRMAKKQRASLIAELDALPPDAPRVLLATGKLVGEGFDHPPLDTLVLAMPVSWKGTLQQYAGRLHREHATKTDVRIIDFVDTGHPALLRMWDKRQRGYRAMGYRIAEQPQEAADLLTSPNSA